MKNLSLTNKMISGFGLLIMIGMLVLLAALYGFQTMKTITMANVISQEFLLREIDHLKWAQSLEQQVRSKSALSVQRNPMLCAFGKWYYGQKRQDVVSFFPKVANSLNALDEPHRKLHAAAEEIHELLESQNYNQALTVLESKVRSNLSEVQAKLGDVRSILNQEIQNYGESAEQVAQLFVFLISVASILMLLIGSVIAYLLISSISKPINQAMAKLDEYGQVFNTLANDLDHSSLNLAQASQTQSEASQETAASVTELQELAQKNVENSQITSEKSMKALEVASQGREVVSGLFDSIQNSLQSNENLVSEIQQSKTDLQTIIDMIAKIDGKTKAINEIVFQTKLLSFNASVEAVRAGAAGAGFAVVAEHVRSLAEMSGTVSNEITTLVNTSRGQVQAIIENTNQKLSEITQEMSQHLTQNAEEADLVHQSFEQIEEVVQQASEYVEQISRANYEQEIGINEISKAIRNIDRVTHENQTSVKKTEAMSHDLKQKSQDLQELVSQLSVLVNGLNSSSVNRDSNELKISEQINSKSQAA